MMLTQRIWLIVLTCVALCSCSQGPTGPPRKETVPVQGQVVVDGTPAAGVDVVCNPVNGGNAQDFTASHSVTDQEGKFAVTTYEAGDGAPVGEYVLTFSWKLDNPVSGVKDGPDKLNGRYMNPAASQHPLKVESGKPVDLGQIQLTTQ
jgi:hypothetical protein